MWSAEPTKALKAVLVGQRDRHGGEQEAEELVSGIQMLMGIIIHSDLFVRRFHP